MYTHFFNLREPPFSITPDPAYLYLSPRHQEALGHLLYGTGQHGGFVQLTGEVGTGKTTIVRTLLAQKLDNVDVAVILNPRQSEQEFVQSICDELHIGYTRAGVTLKQLHDALNTHLLTVHMAGRRTVVIIDEAQNLERNVMEQVRLLTNLETHKEKLLRIMLVGQPELAEILSRPDLRQLSSRVTARYHLTPLSAPETLEYIRHRLRVAGRTDELFPPPVCQLIHRLTGGIPRLVNILCDRSLLGAYALNQKVVTADIVQRAAPEAIGQPNVAREQTSSMRRMLARWTPTDALLAALILVVVVLGWWSMIGRERAATPVADAAPAAVAPVAEANAAPQAPPATAGGGASLTELLSASEPLAVVISRLIRLWSPDLVLDGGAPVCPALAEQGLHCYRGTGEWQDLQLINRPAILTLSTGRGVSNHVLLRELHEDDATLETAQGALRVPLEELATLWTGDFLVLWRPPTDELQIAQPARGPAVIWLRERLARAYGETLQSPVSEVFDNSLREQLVRFQRERGIAADGIAGARTQLLLTALTPVATEPALRSTGGG